MVVRLVSWRDGHVEEVVVPETRSALVGCAGNLLSRSPDELHVELVDGAGEVVERHIVGMATPRRCAAGRPCAVVPLVTRAEEWAGPIPLSRIWDGRGT